MLKTKPHTTRAVKSVTSSSTADFLDKLPPSVREKYMEIEAAARSSKEQAETNHKAAIAHLNSPEWAEENKRKAAEKVKALMSFG